MKTCWRVHTQELSGCHECHCDFLDCTIPRRVRERQSSTRQGICCGSYKRYAMQNVLVHQRKALSTMRTSWVSLLKMSESDWIAEKRTQKTPLLSDHMGGDILSSIAESQSLWCTWHPFDNSPHKKRAVESCAVTNIETPALEQPLGIRDKQSFLGRYIRKSVPIRRGERRTKAGWVNRMHANKTCHRGRS